MTSLSGFGNRLFWLSFMETDMVDQGLIQILESCPNLRGFKLSQCRNITDISISKLAKRCPKLHTLFLFSCRNISDVSIVTLAEGCLKLREFYLADCHLITDTSIIKLAEGYPSLIAYNYQRFKTLLMLVCSDWQKGVLTYASCIFGAVLILLR
jgi:hypothetical protein